MPWDFAHRGGWEVDDQKWELYDVTHDFSEAVNLAEREPGRVKDLNELFWAEAARNHVLPLVDLVKEVMSGRADPPTNVDGAKSFLLYAGMTRIPEGAGPDLKNRSYSIAADLDIAKPEPEGVLLSEGDRFGGLSFYLLKGKPVFYYNYAEFSRTAIAAPDALTPGRHIVTADVKYDGGGRGKGETVTITVDGKQAATGHVPATIPNRNALDASMSVGEGTGAPVSSDYQTPFRLNATLNKLVLTLTDAK